MYTARKKSRSHKHNREIIQHDRFNKKTTKIFYVKKNITINKDIL